MQIVDGLHFGELQQMLTHLLQVDVIGRRFEQDPQRWPEQLGRGLQHEDDDEERGDGVGPIEAPDAMMIPAINVPAKP